VSAAGRARERDAALRRAVLRLRGCLGRMPRAERRVLLLRAGDGTTRTRSRSEVARMTGLSPARVTKLERRGLRRLRALGRQGACAPASGTAFVVITGIAPSAAAAAAGGAAFSGQRSGDGQLKGLGTESVPRLSIGGLTGPPGGSAFDLGYAMVVLAVAIAGFALVRDVRRHR
jgi:DNA-binding CsgD family transcriptional regulator